MHHLVQVVLKGAAAQQHRAPQPVGGALPGRAQLLLLLRLLCCMLRLVLHRRPRGRGSRLLCAGTQRAQRDADRR